MRSLRNLLTIYILLISPAVFAEGLPLPWPFPWARECAVDWFSMQGTYMMADDASSGQLVLTVSNVTDPNGLGMVELSRFAPDGSLSYYGFSIIGFSQRSISVLMASTNPAGAPIFATFNLHYLTAVKQCSKSALVPILSVEGLNSRGDDQVQYKLTLVACEKKTSIHRHH